jgi:thiamine biosynthesis lipoprotein
MKRRVFLGAAIVALVGAGLVLRRAPRRRSRGARTAAGETRFITLTREVMAAPITVEVPEADGAAAAEAVFAVFEEVDARMSEWKATSPLSAVNGAAGGAPVAVPRDLRAVIRRGIEIGALTDGAFDLTWAALWGLWDFRSSEPHVPDEDAIGRRVALVDYRRVEIDDEAGTVRLPEAGMMIGLGGIAKGYALDRAARALRERGVESFLISAAGQMMLGGTRDGRPWRVGIRDPRGDASDFFASLELTDVSVSTSGDYEQFFVAGGVRYHHLLDPRTGRPARGLRSATVVSADATLADALSTALVVLGRDEALALAERLDGVEAVLVDERAAVHVTSGLRDRLHLRHPPAP